MVTGAQDELEAAGVTDPSGDFAAPLNPRGWWRGRDPTAAQPFIRQPRREAALQVISRRYEHGSIILTTNRGIAEWGAIFDDTTVAAAILYRLLYDATVLQSDGDSYRMRGHRARLAQLRAGLNCS
jgi:hypothetical protein